ncbi:hypothetical protein [Eikenella sp. NML03-A-027]|nr:hypothetical protein [Eikenella sp. NML03-A-027]
MGWFVFAEIQPWLRQDIILAAPKLTLSGSLEVVWRLPEKMNLVK